MASQGLTAIRIEALEELGEERVFQLVIEHGTVKKMMNALFKPHPDHPNGNVGHWAFNRWIEKGGPKRKANWENTKLTRAELAVEQAEELLEDATIANVRLKAEQAKQKRWLAGLLNPAYSSKTQVNVQNNNVHVFGQSFADALKALDGNDNEALSKNGENSGEIVVERPSQTAALTRRARADGTPEHEDGT